MTEALADVIPITRYRSPDGPSEYQREMGAIRIAQLREQYPHLEPAEPARWPTPPPCGEKDHRYCRCHGPYLAHHDRHRCPCDQCVAHRHRRTPWGVATPRPNARTHDGSANAHSPA